MNLTESKRKWKEELTSPPAQAGVPAIPAGTLRERSARVHGHLPHSCGSSFLHQK